MLKWIRLTALVAAGAVMTLGCVRGLAAPTAAVEAQTSTVKPMSVKARLMSSTVTVLWHDMIPSDNRSVVNLTRDSASFAIGACCAASNSAFVSYDVTSYVGPANRRGPLAR